MVRKSNEEWKLSRGEFRNRFNQNFFDPAYDLHRDKIAELEEIAWDGYVNSRKAPRTLKAGPEFSDPDYELSVEWLEARKKILEAQKQHEDPLSPHRVLIISGADRNDHTCP